jgi:hypothetical protein
VAGVDPGIDELSRAVDDLLRRLRRWDARGWRVEAAGESPVPGVAVSRAAAAHAAAQRLADLAAVAAGSPRRTVPRLDSDLALPDQLAVTAAEVSRAGDPEAMRAALAEIHALRARLLGR